MNFKDEEDVDISNDKALASVPKDYFSELLSNIQVDMDDEELNCIIGQINDIIRADFSKSSKLFEFPCFDLFLQGKASDLIIFNRNIRPILNLLSNITAVEGITIQVDENFFSNLINFILKPNNDIELISIALSIIANIVSDHEQQCAIIYESNVYNQFMELVDSIDEDFSALKYKCFQYMCQIFNSFFYFDIEDQSLYDNFFTFMIEKKLLFIEGVIPFILDYIKNTEPQQHSIFKNVEFIDNLKFCTNHIENVRLIMEIVMQFFNQDDAAEFCPVVAQTNLMEFIHGAIFKEDMNEINISWPNNTFIELLTVFLSYLPTMQFYEYYSPILRRYIDICFNTNNYDMLSKLFRLFATFLGVHSFEPDLILIVFRKGHIQKILELLDYENVQLMKEIVYFLLNIYTIAEKVGFDYKPSEETMNSFIQFPKQKNQYLEIINPFESTTFRDYIELMLTDDFDSQMENVTCLVDDPEFSTISELLHSKVESYEPGEYIMDYDVIQAEYHYSDQINL